MKILQIHNSYNTFGGEDVVVKSERELLIQNNFKVDTIIFENSDIKVNEVFYNKRSYDLVKNKITKNRPDVIHVHNLFYKATPSILKCAKDHKIPIVMTLHNYRLICPNGLLLRNEKPCMICTNKKFAYNSVRYNCFQNSKSKSLLLAGVLFYHNMRQTWSNHVDKFIVLTPFAKKVFIESSINISESKIIVKPNSVDDFKLDETERNVYTYIGRLSEEKGIQVAVKAFNKLPQLKLEVIGEGPLMEEMKNISNENISFLGRQSKNFIKEQLNKTKGLIFPSICFEGLPNTILEAYSSGTPVIASNIDNINNIVIENVTGRHFNTNDEADLASTIIDFEKNDTSKYGIKTRRIYEENYTHVSNFEGLKKVYSEVMKAY
ncbi:glycosyltransferase [Winogradskyella poriferorum]|uniref:glycosyltransferase n=1 Tax=Winogradskyella poriferorum TaxID=307627 RepID=UPI003D64AAB7